MSAINNIKNKAGIALLLTGIIMAAGCSFPEMSESGSNAMIEVNREDYLDLSVLDKDPAENNATTYETAIVEYGTFEEMLLSTKASVYTPISYVDKASFDSGEMTFEGFLVEKMDYIKKGDPIASVSMSTDSVVIKQAEISLERLKEQYNQALDNYNKGLEDREIPWWYSEKQTEIQNLQWQMADLRWAQSDANYKDRIKESEKNIKELKANAKKTTIVSDYSGYVFSFEDIKVGDLIKNGQTLLTMVPSETTFIEISDEDMQTSWGSKYTVTAIIGRNNRMEVEAEVVSPPLRSVYGDLNQGKAYLELQVSLKYDISRITMYTSGPSGTIENVLLVPASAVEDDGGSICHVTVLHDDGSTVRLPFIPGGHNSSYYWVRSGLKEGTKVIVK